MTPDWPAPPTVHALTSTREIGFSVDPYSSLNLAQHVGDNSESVAENRSLLARQLALPEEPCWLAQMHGTELLNLDKNAFDKKADGSFTQKINKICAVLTADCLPVLICSRAGDRVAALHAGWRGLAAGIVGKGIQAMGVEASELLVWLGPAIGPKKFEVGSEVYNAFVDKNPDTKTAFDPTREGHWLADLYKLARIQLRELGVDQVYGGKHCVFSDEDRFFSYRRDGVTGRMASLIWLQSETGD